MARTKTGARPDTAEALAAYRLAIESVEPEIDGGRFAAKAVAGWPVTISADVFGDGHEKIGAAIVLADGSEVRMTHVENDRWAADVTFDTVGPARFSIVAWRDLFATWRHGASRKVAAGQDISVEMEEARRMFAAMTPPRGEKAELRALEKAAKAGDTETLLSEDTAEYMARVGPRANETRYIRDVPVWVDRERAAFSAWYELFPRSWGPEGRHGTFRDVIAALPYIRDLGFDVLYFPPIHPIGATNRKGKNNSLTAEPGDVGSPYAIGSDDGEMTDVHPELGTMEDFDALVRAASEEGLEIALDIALNASPDHPWIREHPDWFERRPDGTIKYAENPPKKYEDIVNFRYYLDDGRPNLPFWTAIRDMFLHWADHGVLCFRVDNPHTKPFPFWEWLIDEIRARHPGAIFLSEAFTRPKVMKRLAKVGFNQSYTYYTWRNTKAELTEYLTELTTESCRHYMRPNFFTNTPDINPVLLQSSGRAGFRTRLLMAASLSGNYGMYSGFELCEAAPLPGKEEYLDSEKYELKHRDFDADGHIKDDIRLINRIRREEPAMKDFLNLKFFPAFDDRVLYYGRFDAASQNYLLFHVLIDPHGAAEFGFEVPLWEFDLPDEASVEVQDLIQGNRFSWHGKDHTLALDPQSRPYAIWKLTPPGGAA
ncbi:alpha-1,4-glucan:maltose-1-phosphate maltosyltransferase [Roseivivax halodurans JCM 10272]|uniref:Alpha-1,4-glucan:maltose-1-phosphate maltosyltransferase n=1 Tax=Roseivivax halodurans JCM 10272 TaxID=1449350 RepID=X7EDV0_9RHOB|nr:alpha-1,4-glucan--maltose-1-phosphate maltosyltransferase [Roseivivax halodurans]ETX14264.1 alpha-1,4-glucan:maltose-1-phosphate maltosyltransferase [Roseivivax halodurans JCM 10272]